MKENFESVYVMCFVVFVDTNSLGVVKSFSYIRSYKLHKLHRLHKLHKSHDKNYISRHVFPPSMNDDVKPNMPTSKLIHERKP